MRLTVYADYSLRLLIYLAVVGDEVATIPDVAASYRISKNHLVKVAHRLGVEGYITTLRGKNGGLRLSRSAANINVGEVVRVMEPDMALVPCFHPVNAACAILPSCRLRSTIELAQKAFIHVLDGYTIADLAAPRIPLQSLLGITTATSISDLTSRSQMKISRSAKRSTVVTK